MASFNPLSLLSDVGSLLTNLPSIMAIADNIFYLMICLSLGNVVMRAWKRYKNFGLSVILSVLFGLACLVGGVLLSQVIPLQLPLLNGVLQAAITAVILYVIVALLTSGKNVLGKLVSSEQLVELKKSFDVLKNEFNNLKLLLEKRKILPEKITLKELEKNLKTFLESKEIKQYSVFGKEEKDDFITFNIKDNKKNNYQISFDAYTGENTSFLQVNLSLAQKFSNVFSALLKNKHAITGLVLAIIFGIYMTSLINESSINAINARLSVTGSISSSGVNFNNYQINNTSCLTLNDFLFVTQTENVTKVNASNNVINKIKQLYSSESLMSGGMKISYNNTEYYLVSSSIINETSMGLALQDYLKNNLLSVIQGSINFCALSYNNKTFDNLIHVCVVRVNDANVCECKILKDAAGYCDLYSSMLSQDFSNKLGSAGIDSSALGNLFGVVSKK